MQEFVVISEPKPLKRLTYLDKSSRLRADPRHEFQALRPTLRRDRCLGRGAKEIGLALWRAKLNYLGSVTASAIAATAISTSAAAARAFFPGPGNVHCQSASTQCFAIHRFNSLLRLFRCAHGNKGEAAGAAGSPVGRQVGFQNTAVCRKGVLQFVFSDFVVEVPDE